LIQLKENVEEKNEGKKKTTLSHIRWWIHHWSLLWLYLSAEHEYETKAHQWSVTSSDDLTDFFFSSFETKNEMILVFFIDISTQHLQKKKEEMKW